jgi:hypothetical protein
MLDDVATGRSHEQLEVTSGQEEFVAFELDN